MPASVASLPLKVINDLKETRMATQSSSTNILIKLNNVKLSYPSIFNPKVWPGAVTKPKYEATFILDKVKHLREINEINSRIDDILKDLKTTRAKIKDDNMCFKDGDLLDKPEYANTMTLRTKSLRKFPIVDSDGITLITEEDHSKFYGGAIVSAYVSLWSYPKPNTGIAANLSSIQFRAHGPLLNSGEQDITGAYDPVPDEEEMGYVSVDPEFKDFGPPVDFK